MFNNLEMTVEDIISLECMKDTKIIGGRAGLNRRVKNVTIMEVPDVSDWLYPGDLLLTTAYPIRHNEPALVNLVSQLSDKRYCRASH